MFTQFRNLEKFCFLFSDKRTFRPVKDRGTAVGVTLHFIAWGWGFINPAFDAAV